ncbi:MAG: hypothetical protein H6711_09980 [Myxococcales bacterium]|nr:hypothetical protein [Myxococcales bacterium]
MSVGTGQHPREPNHFELRGHGTRLTYSTTSLSGKPILHYEFGGESYSFTGADIRRASTEIGDLVTVTLESVVDLHVITLSLLLPAINLHQDTAEFSTKIILTEHRTSIGGPALVKGALQVYESRTLHGVASFIVS